MCPVMFWFLTLKFQFMTGKTCSSQKFPVWRTNSSLSLTQERITVNISSFLRTVFILVHYYEMVYQFNQFNQQHCGQFKCFKSCIIFLPMAPTDSSHEAVITSSDNKTNKNRQSSLIRPQSHRFFVKSPSYEPAFWISVWMVFCILRCFVLVTADLSHIILFVTVKHVVCHLILHIVQVILSNLSCTTL